MRAGDIQCSNEGHILESLRSRRIPHAMHMKNALKIARIRKLVY